MEAKGAYFDTISIFVQCPSCLNRFDINNQHRAMSWKRVEEPEGWQCPGCAEIVTASNPGGSAPQIVCTRNKDKKGGLMGETLADELDSIAKGLKFLGLDKRAGVLWSLAQLLGIAGIDDLDDLHDRVTQRAKGNQQEEKREQEG